MLNILMKDAKRCDIKVTFISLKMIITKVVRKS